MTSFRLTHEYISEDIEKNPPTLTAKDWGVILEALLVCYIPVDASRSSKEFADYCLELVNRITNDR